MTTEPVPERIRTIERPHPALWTYYIIRAICTGPGLVVTLPYLYFRYHTFRYRFDEEGIHIAALRQVHAEAATLRHAAGLLK